VTHEDDHRRFAAAAEGVSLVIAKHRIEDVGWRQLSHLNRSFSETVSAFPSLMERKA
jgi:hypothetical protein